MITAGIDVGLEYIKAVVMKDGKLLGKASGHSGGVGRPAAVQAVYDKALEAAGVQAGDVEKVYATGKGKFDVTFADDKIAEVVTAAKAAKLSSRIFLKKRKKTRICAKICPAFYPRFAPL